MSLIPSLKFILLRAHHFLQSLLLLFFLAHQQNNSCVNTVLVFDMDPIGIIISANSTDIEAVKVFRILGLIFLLLGIVMLVTGGFDLKRDKKVLDTDLVDMNKKETHRFRWNPYVSGAVIVGGIVLLAAGGRSTKNDP